MKPVPETLTLEPFFSFVVGATWNRRGPWLTGMVVVVVVVVVVGSANVMGARAASALGGLVLTTMAQFVRSVDEVPQVDGVAVEAIVPVTTVTEVVKVPVALVVAMATVLVSQSVWLVEAPRLMHSRAYKVSLAWKPLPETDTAVPPCSPVLGVSWIVV